MGKGAAKYGFRSGILPSARSVLKNPTVRQEILVKQARAPRPKGSTGIGYADGVSHPKGSHREPQPVKFIDVEKLIQNTVASPQNIHTVNSKQQEKKLRRAELRRQYLADAFKREEERLLKHEELIEKRKLLLEDRRQKEVALLDQTKSSDLTIPTLEGMLEQPLMRQRTDDEKQLLDMKREYNRNLIEFRSTERRMEKLLDLYHIADEFIVTEKQLLQKVEEAFKNEGSDVLRTKLSLGMSRIRSRNEGDIGDALFGTTGGGEHIGLPTVKEFLSGEMEEFASEVETKNREVMNNKKNNMDTIL